MKGGERAREVIYLHRRRERERGAAIQADLSLAKRNDCDIVDRSGGSHKEG
jgi:hypothetical protein